MVEGDQVGEKPEEKENTCRGWRKKKEGGNGAWIGFLWSKWNCGCGWG